ncbi:MAPEG family protein [Sphingomonas sp. LaA6.9]|uniref:MAPEG family protein n=1 Tax=Sphingomonas sp. LaA6.9 TaxID=2919914 RepID=UPI001F4FD02F|nr:MAPEG family protein [Sphingomonas sp. LaA6.9]MCJ8158620.1 MAPEG family protein [Sphingomonas sp. LaA6.9]
MILPITLTIAGAAAVVNIWLAMRVGRVRTAEKVSIGDGGNPQLTARMRAHANFVEYTPFVLILIGLIEFANGTTLWLWGVGALYILARVAHAFGMDGVGKARMVGTLVTFLTLLGLGLYAIAIPYLAGGTDPVVTDIQAVG